MTDNPNLDRVIEAFRADPEPLIEWAAHEIVSLGAQSEWDMEDNFNCTEGLVGLATESYDLPPAGNQGDEALLFYGEAAKILGYRYDMAPSDGADEDDEDDGS